MRNLCSIRPGRQRTTQTFSVPLPARLRPAGAHLFPPPNPPPPAPWSLPPSLSAGSSGRRPPRRAGLEICPSRWVFLAVPFDQSSLVCSGFRRAQIIFQNIAGPKLIHPLFAIVFLFVTHFANLAAWIVWCLGFCLARWRTSGRFWSGKMLDATDEFVQIVMCVHSAIWNIF